MVEPLSINTDYRRDAGDPKPFLRRIAEAGFRYIHWCHHWATDYLYSDHEIEQVGRWLKEFDLRLNDLHASHGQEYQYFSPREYTRRAGVALIKNRIDMTTRLGSDTIILHLHAEPVGEQLDPNYWPPVHRSLDELLPYARERGVRIALENLFPSNHATLSRVLSEYDPEDIGVCFDPGHANIVGDGLEFLETVMSRLIALHLNDNDGASDQHRVIFAGIHDWDRLAAIIAASGYTKPLGLEVTMDHTGIDDEKAFLTDALTTGTRFAQMVANHRAVNPPQSP